MIKPSLRCGLAEPLAAKPKGAASVVPFPDTALARPTLALRRDYGEVTATTKCALPLRLVLVPFAWTRTE